MYRFIIFVVIAGFYASLGFGQIYVNGEEPDEAAFEDSTSYQILKIDIIGNEKTRPEVILRELHFSENEPVSHAALSAAFKRVQSLMLFNRVKFDLVGDSEYSSLLITVYERWYIFPIPVLYRNERDWRKISFGGKLLYYNFLGRNILLNFSAAFGYNPLLKFSYYNPWFMGDLKLFTNFSIYYGKVRSLSPELNEYEDTRTGFDWLIGKRFGHYFYAGLTISYAEIKAPPEIGLTLSPSGTDRFPSLTATVQYDNRDLKEYPHQGWFLTLSGKRAGNGGVIQHYRYGADLRTYAPISRKTTLALRAAVDLSSGKIPSYDRVYFGYWERLRGHYYDVYEGENLAFAGAEFRFPILKIRYIDVETLPELEQYSSNLKFGVSAGLFAEAGKVWNHDDALTLKYFKPGFGAGVHFHVPYVEVFRLECGFDFDWNPSLIAEVEVAF